MIDLRRMCCAGLLLALACGGGGGGGPYRPAPAAANADAAKAEIVRARASALALLLTLQAADELEAQRAALTPEREPDVIYVPTPEPVVDKMLELAEVASGDVVYDLGCGDGRIVIAAALRYGVEAWGFDIDPVRVAEARANAKLAGVEQLVTIEEKDIFTLDLSPASVVTLYLLPELNVRLIPQLRKLKPGSRIVSHAFDMKGVEPAQQIKMQVPPSGRQHLIYLWQTPFKEPS